MTSCLFFLYVFGTVASLALESTGIYRVTDGELIVALLDGVIVAAMLDSLAYPG